MTWGNYCNPAGVVVGLASLVLGFFLSVTKYQFMMNTGGAVVLVYGSVLLGVAVASLSKFDQVYVNQVETEERERTETAQFEQKVHSRATQLYEEYLENAPKREMITYFKNPVPPSEYVERARKELKHQHEVNRPVGK